MIEFIRNLFKKKPVIKAAKTSSSFEDRFAARPQFKSKNEGEYRRERDRRLENETRSSENSGLDLTTAVAYGTMFSGHTASPSSTYSGGGGSFSGGGASDSWSSDSSSSSSSCDSGSSDSSSSSSSSCD